MGLATLEWHWEMSTKPILDSTERKSLLLCMTEYGKMFKGHSSFMNGDTGRLVTLDGAVKSMTDCVEISTKLLKNDIEVGTVGAEEAALLCDGAMEALSAVLIDPALKKIRDEEKENKIVSSSLGSVKVEKKTMDLDSDGEGMEDFDIE